MAGADRRRSRQERGGVPQANTTMPRWRRCSPTSAAIAWTTLVEAFAAADDDVPTLFIAWTIKGYGLPFAGHKDNHAGLMNPTQMAALREAWACAEGHEWEPLEGIGDNARAARRNADRAQPHRPRQAAARVRLDRGPAHPRARRRGAVDPGRVRPHPARPVQGRRRRSPTASSPPRPTSPSRPTSAPGSTSAACSAEGKWPTFLPRQRLHLHKSGRRQTKANTSSLASPRTTFS